MLKTPISLAYYRVCGLHRTLAGQYAQEFYFGDVMGLWLHQSRTSLRQAIQYGLCAFVAIHEDGVPWITECVETGRDFVDFPCVHLFSSVSLFPSHWSNVPSTLNIRLRILHSVLLLCYVQGVYCGWFNLHGTAFALTLVSNKFPQPNEF